MLGDWIARWEFVWKGRGGGGGFVSRFKKKQAGGGDLAKAVTWLVLCRSCFYTVHQARHEPVSVSLLS